MRGRAPRWRGSVSMASILISTRAGLLAGPTTSAAGRRGWWCRSRNATTQREPTTMATTNKIAVITGAGSGIGRATALALYADGFSVMLAGRRRDMLEETRALAKATAPSMLVAPTDVMDPTSVTSLFETV